MMNPLMMLFGLKIGRDLAGSFSFGSLSQGVVGGIVYGFAGLTMYQKFQAPFGKGVGLGVASAGIDKVFPSSLFSSLNLGSLTGSNTGATGATGATGTTNTSATGTEGSATSELV